MMFAIAGVPFEDVRIQSDKWPELKKATPFGTVPVLDVDGEQIGQSLAILRYVARETGFAGPDNLTAALADALCDQYVDLKLSTQQWHYVNIGLLKGDKSSTGWYANTAEITHADAFIAANLEMLTRLDKNPEKLFEGYPLMEAHYKKFFAHPKLQKYLAERPDARF